MLSIFALLHLPLAADGTGAAPIENASTATSLESEWQLLCSNHGVKTWYMNSLEDNSILETAEDLTRLPALKLFEFCEEDSRFNRKSSQVRKNIEKDILADIGKILEKEPQDTTIRLLSLGCTGLLQDWYIVGQLIRQGRTHIDLTIVDTKLFQGPVEGFEKLSKALKSEGITLHVRFLNSLDSLTTGPKETFHCVYAINYFALLSFEKDTWKNLSRARKLLVQNGHLFASYLNEILTIDAKGKINVVETSPENQQLREAIVAAQRSNPRSKDCSIRIQIESLTPYFIAGPLLYATSDLLEDGYQDIMIYAPSPGLKQLSESDLSALFSDISTSKGKTTLHWKRKFLITDIRQDRRDMVILYLKGFDFHSIMDRLHRSTVLWGKLVPEKGHWLVFADQLGLWDIDGLGQKKIIFLPKEHEKTAKEFIEKIFAPGGHWE
jgi:hypothetical protein